MLIKCQECGKEISSEAKKCPNCGVKTEVAKKNTKKLIIITSIIIILVLLSITSIFIIKKLNNKSNLSAKEVVLYLQDKGYEFQALKSATSLQTTYYIYSSKDDIHFQRIYGAYLGRMYSWKNDNINDDWAEIEETDKNNTTAKKKQYEGYQNWLKKLGLNDTQIIEALDYYYSNTSSFTNMDNILK